MLWRTRLIGRRFLWDQESQLWDIFQDLDKNGDGRLDATEMRAALSRSGIDITQATVTDLVRFLASGARFSPAARRLQQSGNEAAALDRPAGSAVAGVDEMYITFKEFRDFLIMLPRKATPFEIYKCELPAARVNVHQSVARATLTSGSLSGQKAVHGWKRRSAGR